MVEPFKFEPIRLTPPTKPVKLVEAREEVLKLVKLMNDVCGISEFWAKTAIYYCIATHHLPEIEWMVALIVLAPSGSGKSYLIDILRKLCYMPSSFSCHERMTAVSLRNELIRAKNRTVVIEEADLYPNRKELESYIISRVTRDKDLALPMTLKRKDEQWETIKESIPGATIIHDRHELNVTAAERRAIYLPIHHYKDRKFFKPSKEYIESLKLPQIALGNIPNIFNDPKTSSSGMDIWEPFIRIGDSLGDDEWINLAWKRVLEANEKLADGQQWEIEVLIFRGLVAGYSDNKTGSLLGNIDTKPLVLSEITNFVRQEYEWVHPKTISTKLRKMGFDVHLKGGDSYVFTNIEQIKQVAKDMDYVDSALG